MRPKQWVKNVFVFAGIVFARGQLLLKMQSFVKVLIAFILFCLVSSSVYLINDLVDVERDRQHPRKRLRPIASGQLSPGLAALIAIVLSIGCISVTVGMALNKTHVHWEWIWFGAVLLLYFILQLAYTFALKDIVLVDLFVITAGFVLRAVGGAVVISVSITNWWLLCLFFLALFLGLGKRRNELFILTREADNHRRTLREYSPQLLDQLMMIDVACTIMVYSQATFTTPLATEMHHPLLMLTVPFVVFALFRYLYLIMQKNEGGEPTDLLFRDRPLGITIMAWGLLVLAIQSIRF
jgi:4-hydroxybenzoate polyprenyltransferase